MQRNRNRFFSKIWFGFFQKIRPPLACASLGLVTALFVASPALLAGSLPDPTAQFTDPDAHSVRLGRLLFYDPILSGNREVACATCHHPKFATSDGVSLGIGDGGIGLGPERVADPANPPEQRIPRNSPALFNLGAAQFTRFFHDGRLEDDPAHPHAIRTPLGPDMTKGFTNALSAQAMFPVLSPDEMAGHYSENEIAQAVRQGVITGPGGAWEKLTARVAAIPEYAAGFQPLTGDRPLHFTDIANVLADFIAFEWRADDSPFDAYLRGKATLTPEAMQGMDLFYGSAGCAACHSGLFQTDHSFHAIAMPQIGPGKAARFERHARDIGRMRVTGLAKDAYAFRTPSLRNVTATAPYGHSGAYATLEAVIRHHLDPRAALAAYVPDQAVLARLPVDDLWALRDPQERFEIAESNSLIPQNLTDREIGLIIAFLDALTDANSIAGRLGVPASVPSGLMVPQ